MAATQTRHWCFTLNNYTDHDISSLDTLEVTYLVYGREVATTGTPHLQGYVVFQSVKRFNQVRDLIPNAHVEPKRASSKAAALYCKKDGLFTERGTLPSTGVKCQIEAFKEWVLDHYNEHGSAPSRRLIAATYPGLFVRYSERLLELIKAIIPLPVLQEGELREWQQELKQTLDGDADDRTILFFVDPEGAKGKSWFQRWYFTQDQGRVQLLSSGKRDDVAHAIDPDCSVFLFNIPRGSMEYLQYSVLEMLKDRFIFSPKYNSKTKTLRTNPHVVIFSNECPNMDAMTSDRYEVVYI